jgi:nicotinamidase-related amidase
MINDLEFAGGECMLNDAQNAAQAVAELSRQARSSGVPVVYVNDNYGQWHSQRSLLVEHCARQGSRGAGIVKMLEPQEEDFFVVKPQFSGFYSTYLPALLPRLGASRLILTGIAADICVLFTAADAHMREYQLWVPENCVASSNRQRTIWALEIMKNSMHAETQSTREIKLNDWLQTAVR